MGSEMCIRDRNNEAIEYYLKALEAFTQWGGENHLHVTTVLSNLGIAHTRLHQYKEAEAYVDRALTIRLGQLEHNHPDVLHSRRLLATLQKAQGNLEAAQQGYLDILAMHDASNDDESSMLETLRMLGAVTDEMGEHAEAIVYYLSLIHI